MIWKEINILLSLYDFEQNYSNYYIPFFTINFKEKYQTIYSFVQLKSVSSSEFYKGNIFIRCSATLFVADLNEQKQKTLL